MQVASIARSSGRGLVEDGEPVRLKSSLANEALLLAEREHLPLGDAGCMTPACAEAEHHQQLGDLGVDLVLEHLRLRVGDLLPQ